MSTNPNQCAPAPAHHNVQVGDDVFYCVRSGDCEKGTPAEFRPAKVVKHWGGGCVNLVVTIDGQSDYHAFGIATPGGFPELCHARRTSVSHNSAGIAGTWCFGRK
jgi:hypothetical protein